MARIYELPSHDEAFQIGEQSSNNQASSSSRVKRRASIQGEQKTPSPSLPLVRQSQSDSFDSRSPLAPARQNRYGAIPAPPSRVDWPAAEELFATPAGGREMQRRQIERNRGCLYGLLLGLGLSVMVSAQMIRRDDNSRPDSATARAILIALGIWVAGQYWFENGIRTVTVGARESVGQVWHNSLRATRWPDKAADWTASWVAERLSGGDSAAQQMLRDRFPGEPYPIQCRGEIQIPGCGDPYGYAVAKQHAPYWYAGWGVAVGTGLGAAAGRYYWKPVMSDRVVPFVQNKILFIVQPIHHFFDISFRDPPGDWTELGSRAVKAVSKSVAKVGRDLTSWARPMDEELVNVDGVEERTERG